MAPLNLGNTIPDSFIFLAQFNLGKNSIKIWAHMEFVKKFTPADFQAKNFTPSISPNFNSFSGKKTQKKWKWRNLRRWQKFYTAAGSDGMDKFHLWRAPWGTSLQDAVFFYIKVLQIIRARVFPLNQAVLNCPHCNGTFRTKWPT